MSRFRKARKVARAADTLPSQFRVSQPILWRCAGFMCGSAAPHSSQWSLCRHAELLVTVRERWDPEVSEVMLADTICSSLLILADMRHQRRAERQMVRQGEKLCLSANCFLTLFWVCVCVCIGTQLELWDHHRAVTMSGWHAATCPHENWENISPHQTKYAHGISLNEARLPWNCQAEWKLYLIDET